MAFIKQIKVGNNTYDIHKKVTVTIAAADWTAATIDKTVSGMTVNDIVVVSPAPSSIIGARNSVVYCSAIKANALSFTYSVAAPTTALTFNVLWVQAATTDTDKGAIINTVMGGKIPTGTLNVNSTLSNYDTYLNNVRYINLGAGSLNVSGSAISSVSGSGSVNPGANTISKNSATNVSTGTVTTTKPTSGVYVAVDATTAQGSGNINISASGTAKAGVTTAGYVHNETASSNISKSGTASVTVPAKSAATTYIPITSTNVVEKAGSVSNNTYTQGKVTVDTAGYISAGDKVSGASFANTATTNVTYKDISGTTAAPILVSNDYLYINKGYTDNVKISLAKLVPDGASAALASDKILNGYSAYDNDGNLIAGSIPTITPAFDGGGLSGNNISDSQTKGSVTISESGTFFADAAKTNFGVTTNKPSGTDGTNYLTIHEAHSTASGTATGSTTITRGAVLYKGDTTGYVDKADNTQALASGSKTVSASITVTPSVTDNFEPYYIPIVTPAFDGGALSATNSTTDTGALSGGALTAGAGEVSITTTPVVTPSVSGTAVSSTSQTNFGVTTTKPSGTDGTDYITLDPSGSVTTTGKTKGRGSVTREIVNRAKFSSTVTRGAVLYNGAKHGAVNIADNTQALASGSTTVSLAAGSIASASGTSNWSAEANITPTIVAGTNYYIPVSAASASATAGTATATAGTTSTTGLTEGTYQTTATSGYTYSITATGGSASATGGNASASVSKGVTSGATKNATGASTGTKTGASATIYLVKATPSTTNGTASATANAGTASVTTNPSASASATQTGMTDGVSTTATSYYFTSSASADAGKLTATGGSARAYVTASSAKVTKGYAAADTTASTTASDTGTKTGNTVTTASKTASDSSTVYLKAATCSVTRDSAPSATIAKAPTATTTASSATTEVKGMKTVTTDTGYSVSASATSGSASATSGYSTASVGAIYDTHTAGYLPNKSKTKIFDAASATATEKTAHSDAKTASETKYIQKGVLGATVDCDITFTPSVSTNMSTISKPSTGTEGTDYFSITGSGTTSGAATGSASVSTEGYVKNETATSGSATGTIGSNAKKYVRKATITNNTSGGTSSGTINRGKQIKIGAGYNPTDLYYTAQAAPTLSGNAAADDVLSGKTFYSNSYTIQTGSMANNGSTGGTISTKTGTISIPAGYTTGGSVSISTTEQNKIVAGNIKKGVTVLGVDGTYTSDATATAANILSNKTAYVNGAKISGTMADRGAVTPTALNPGGSYTIPAGYHNGSGKVTARALNNQAKSPTDIIVGTAITPDSGRDGLSSVTIPSNATIIVDSNNILNVAVPPTSSSVVNYDSLDNEGGANTQLNAVVGGSTLNTIEVMNEATTNVNVYETGILNINRISGTVQSDDLVASNIRKGASILGVVGTYAASSTASDIYKAQYAGNVSSGWSTYWSSSEGNMGATSEFTETLSTPIPQGASVRLKYNDFGPNASSGAGFRVYLVSNSGTTQLIADPSASESANGPHNSSGITSNFAATRIKVEKFSAAGETVSTYQLLAVEVHIAVPSGYYGVTAASGGSTLADVSSYQYMAVKKATLGNEYTPSTSTQSVKVKGEGWVKTSDNVATIKPISTETQTVTLSLASGNQTVHATDGKYMTSVTINKPSTLVAGNIKRGVTIAGVTGKTTVVDTEISEGSANFPITEDAVLAGYKGFVNGVGIEGTISSKSAATYTPTTTNQTIAAGKYLAGAQTIKGDANLVASNIKKGVTIFGVAGTYEASGGGGSSENTLKKLLDTTKSTYYLFYNYTGSSVNDLISHDDTENVTNMQNMFNGCSHLTSIPLLNTSKVTTMGNMFKNCTNLTTIPQLNTSNVTSMTYMFHSCKALTSIPQLDTSKVINMSYMFYGCTSLTTIPALNTNSVSNMNNMFSGCSKLTTVPALDANKVTNMSGMFNNCPKLKSILMTHIGVNLDIHYSTQFERADLVTILNNLRTVTSSKKLTMGSTNLNKLTAADKAIATNKGWTLA